MKESSDHRIHQVSSHTNIVAEHRYEYKLMKFDGTHVILVTDFKRRYQVCILEMKKKQPTSTYGG